MVVTVNALELDQAVTATSLAQLTCILGLATSTKRTLDVQARVLVGLNHPLATVILLHVTIMHTMVPATSIRNTLVITVHALEKDQVVTAITCLAQVTRIFGLVTTIKRTLEVQARVPMG